MTGATIFGKGNAYLPWKRAPFKTFISQIIPEKKKYLQYFILPLSKKQGWLKRNEKMKYNERFLDPFL